MAAITKLDRHKLIHNPAKSKAWLVNKMQNIKNASRSSLLDDSARKRADYGIGKMFFFVYDAKEKEKLPYWDQFPLVIPIETYHDGFLGLNLHYLSPNYRAVLLGNLTDTANNNKFNETTRLRLSYDILSSTRRYKEFEPCIKKYLASQIRTQFIYVDPSEWSEAIFLPVHSFTGAAARTVWNESQKKVR